jgi:hypothetical protein
MATPGLDGALCPRASESNGTDESWRFVGMRRVAITVHFITREEGGKLAGRTKMNQLSLKERKEFISESTSVGLHTEETLQAETRKSNA